MCWIHLFIDIWFIHAQHSTVWLQARDVYVCRDDAGKKTKCFAKYANDALGVSGSSHKNNAQIALDEENRVGLIATRNIKAYQEIFCSYGKRYWRKHG